jgi:hypothetical protein
LLAGSGLDYCLDTLFAPRRQLAVKNSAAPFRPGRHTGSTLNGGFCMAKDKRHPMSTDMNDIDLNTTSALTDEERENLQKGLADADKDMS